MAIWRAGQVIALRTISTPVFWSSFWVRMRLSASEARSRATPPPGTMPSSTAARVACIASSTRSFPSPRLRSRRRRGSPRRRRRAWPDAPAASRGRSPSGFLDLRLDLIDPRLDVSPLAGAADDGGVLLVDHHLLGSTEHGERDVFHLDAEIFRDRLAAGQNREVLQHGLAAIAEAGSLDGRDLQATAQAVDDEGSQRLAFDVFGDYHERLAALHYGFQQRKQFIQLR